MKAIYNNMKRKSNFSCYLSLGLWLVLAVMQFSPAEAVAQTDQTGNTGLYNKVVAHRGAWKKTGLPQNSIASLKRAIRLGCMGSEFDVQMTLDDSLIVNHDPTFNGLTIEKSTYRQLMQTPLKNGEKLPTLRQYLKAALAKNSRTTPVLEIKPSVISKGRAIQSTKSVLSVVREFKAMDKIIFISFDFDVLKEIHRQYPQAITQYLNGDKTPATLKAAGIRGADYHFSVFQQHPDWIREAKEQGIMLNAWTVDDTTTIDWLLASDFDAITTNRPELVAARAARHKKIYGNKKLVFADEFNLNGAPDNTKWKYDTGSHGWGNHELQNYTNADSNNVYVSHGLLHIVAQKDADQPKGYSSVRMVQKKGFLFGRLEVRAKLPPGRGLWPAIWLLPDKFSYGGWPASGEIDLMENVGYNPDTVFFTVHTQKYNHIKGTQKSKGIYDPTLYQKFHTYALEWTADTITFFLDDRKVFSFANEHEKPGYKSWPFDNPFHLILNIAVGGDWGGKQGIDADVFPASMLVDYVRIYQ